MTPPTTSKAAKLAWIAGMLGMASIGTVNMVLPLVPDSRLAGVEVPAPVPKLTAGGVWKETFQRDAVVWFEQHWGLRGDVVRTDNTLNVGLFHETRTGQQVVIGDDGVLFNSEDSGYVNRTDTDDAGLEAGRMIARVQRKARAHGHVMIPILIPSKTSVYRDAYPRANRRRGAFGRSDATVHGAMVRGMRENGAVFVDARTALLAEAKTLDDVFSKGGRHWRWGAACRAIQLALDAARPDVPELGDEQLDCHSHRDPNPKIEGWDLDLFWLLNLWNQVPRDVEGEVLDGKTGGLRVPTLFVGTSFVTMFAEISREHDVLQPSLFYYYNARVANTLRPLDGRDIEPNTPRWHDDTFSHRLFLVGILETFSPGDGLKFMQQIEKDLDARSAPKSSTGP